MRGSIYSKTGSTCSGGSMDRLSEKEIGAIRKLMMEKKQEERKCNIFFAIKGGKEIRMWQRVRFGHRNL